MNNAAIGIVERISEQQSVSGKGNPVWRWFAFRSNRCSQDVVVEEQPWLELGVHGTRGSVVCSLRCTSDSDSLAWVQHAQKSFQHISLANVIFAKQHRQWANFKVQELDRPVTIQMHPE